MASPRCVRSLLGHAQVEMALVCLGSLLSYSAERLRLALHDDGTLTAEDRERLRAGLAGAEIVDARESEALLSAFLAEHPASRAFRERNPLARKLLDIPLIEAADAVAYCDADILFLRPFRGLYLFPGDEVAAVFQADRQNAYSVRSWQLLVTPRLRLAARVNSGIVHFRKSRFDPDLIEWFLGRPDFQKTPAWVEQTAWALLAGAAECRLIDPQQVAIPAEDPREEAGDPIALHFVSPLRRRLAISAAGAPDRRAEAASQVRFQATGSCGAWSALRAEAARRLHR